MSSRMSCPQCLAKGHGASPKMWHDGTRWCCLCGWEGDEDDWLAADACSRTVGKAGETMEQALARLGPFFPGSVVMMWPAGMEKPTRLSVFMPGSVADPKAAFGLDCELRHVHLMSEDWV